MKAPGRTSHTKSRVRIVASLAMELNNPLIVIIEGKGLQTVGSLATEWRPVRPEKKSIGVSIKKQSGQIKFINGQEDTSSTESDSDSSDNDEDVDAINLLMNLSGR